MTDHTEEIIDVACRMAQDLQEYVDAGVNGGSEMGATKLLLEEWDEVFSKEISSTPTEHDARRYRYLRNRDLDVSSGGVFAGMVPDNVILNGVDLDNEVDKAILEITSDFISIVN